MTVRESPEFSHAVSLGAERPADLKVLARLVAVLRLDPEPAVMATRLLDLHDKYHGGVRLAATEESDVA